MTPSSRWVGLACALAGCSFQITPGGVGGDAAPSDARGDAMTIDAPADGPLTDLDGDGVLNAADNCPTVANPDQRNHDGDNRGDRCDVCPHISSAIHADNDADGIGDDCDPRPNQAGDTVAIWEGFYDDSTVLTTWTVSGTWTLANGSLNQGLTATAYIAAPITLPRTFVQAEAFLVSLSGGTSTLGVFAGDPLDNQQSYGCLASRNGNTHTYGAYSKWGGMTSVFSTQAWTGLVAGQTYRFQQLLMTDNACAIRQGATTVTDTEAVGPITGKTGIYLDDAQIRLDYFFAVSIGP